MKEITRYMGYYPSIICKNGDVIWAFTPARLKWTSYTVLLSELHIFNVCNAIETEELQWFVTTNQLSTASAYLFSCNKAQPVQVNWRIHCGLLYHPLLHTVFLLGGVVSGRYRGGCEQVVSTANSFNIATGMQESLMDMQQSRSDFVPCWYAEKGYLIGGGSRLIESFDPITRLFTLIPDVKIALGKGSCQVVSLCNSLYIFAKKLTMWTPGSKTMLTVVLDMKDRPKGLMSAGVVFEGHFYIPAKRGKSYCAIPMVSQEETALQRGEREKINRKIIVE